MNSPFIVLDPGHGGDEPAGNSSPYGGRSPGGLLEKRLTLALAGRIADRLGGRAALTRDRDENLPIAERIERARRSGATDFVSLHFNQGPPGCSGPEIWVHPRSNAASLVRAHSLARSMARPGQPPTVRQAEIAVIGPGRLPGDVAACLLEVDYLSDPDTERWIREGGGLDAMADQIVEGLEPWEWQNDVAFGARKRDRRVSTSDLPAARTNAPSGRARRNTLSGPPPAGGAPAIDRRSQTRLFRVQQIADARRQGRGDRAAFLDESEKRPTNQYRWPIPVPRNSTAPTPQADSAQSPDEQTVFKNLVDKLSKLPEGFDEETQSSYERSHKGKLYFTDEEVVQIAEHCNSADLEASILDHFGYEVFDWAQRGYLRKAGVCGWLTCRQQDALAATYDKWMKAAAHATNTEVLLFCVARRASWWGGTTAFPADSTNEVLEKMVRAGQLSASQRAALAAHGLVPPPGTVVQKEAGKTLFDPSLWASTTDWYVSGQALKKSWLAAQKQFSKSAQATQDGPAQQVTTAAGEAIKGMKEKLKDFFGDGWDSLPQWGAIVNKNPLVSLFKLVKKLLDAFGIGDLIDGVDQLVQAWQFRNRVAFLNQQSKALTNESPLRSALEYARRKIKRAFRTALFRGLSKIVQGVCRLLTIITAAVAGPVTEVLNLSASLAEQLEKAGRSLKGLYKFFTGRRGRNRKLQATLIVNTAKSGRDGSPDKAAAAAVTTYLLGDSLREANGNEASPPGEPDALIERLADRLKSQPGNFVEEKLNDLWAEFKDLVWHFLEPGVQKAREKFEAVRERFNGRPDYYDYTPAY